MSNKLQEMLKSFSTNESPALILGEWNKDYEGIKPVKYLLEKFAHERVLHIKQEDAFKHGKLCQSDNVRALYNELIPQIIKGKALIFMDGHVFNWLRDEDILKDTLDLIGLIKDNRSKLVITGHIPNIRFAHHLLPHVTINEEEYEVFSETYSRFYA